MQHHCLTHVTRQTRWGLPLALWLVAQGAMADMQEKALEYTLDGIRFSSTLVWDGDEKAPRPALLMVPNWLGPSPAALRQAREIAGDDYVVMLVDMYGAEVRPSNTEEASKAAAAVRGDRALMRARVRKALDVLRGEAGAVPLDPQRVAAIGFCFGGGTVLELARSGADVQAVVAFHGNLDTPSADDARHIKASVLVLHGADDPYVPPAQVQSFITEMQNAKVEDWQLVQFGGAVHSFTDPDANRPGEAQYHPRTARRAFEMMDDLLGERFGSD